MGDKNDGWIFLTFLKTYLPVLYLESISFNVVSTHITRSSIPV